MDDLLNTEILATTFDDMAVGVGIFQILDMDDIESIRYVFMNKVILYEMRKTREEVFGKRIIEVAPEAYQHEGGLYVINTYRKVAQTGESINLGLVEYSNHMVAGTYECSVHPIKDNYVYVLLRNVTELEQTKNELERKNKDLSQFAYVASHDLKEPLNTISSLIESIRDQYRGKLDEEADDMLSFISIAAGRMRNVINDLLEYSSIGNENEMTSVDCNQLLQEIQQDLDVKIKDANANIKVGKLPTIQGFSTALRLLFQNLISNGIKFRKAGEAPEINISATEEAEGWTFRIEDNGIGISEKHKDKIFNIFERLHSRSEYEGTGIGLAHCKRIIELHKGKIWVSSEPGQGSTFHFTIPNQP